MATTTRKAKSKAKTAKKSPGRATAAKKVAKKVAKKAARKPTSHKAPVKAPARKPAAKKARPAATPPGYHALTPSLVVRGADAAIALYKKAFDAKLELRMAMPDGSVMHAEMRIGDSRFMLSEENPAWDSKSPLLLGGNATHLMMYTPDVDAAVARAVDAGFTVVMPPTDMFWGDRYAKVADAFGHHWSIATQIEVVPPKEMARRAADWGKQMEAQQAGASAG